MIIFPVSKLLSIAFILYRYIPELKLLVLIIVFEEFSFLLKTNLPVEL